MTAVYVMLGWLGVATVAAPLVGKVLSRVSPEPEDELLAWLRSLRDEEGER